MAAAVAAVAATGREMIRSSIDYVSFLPMVSQLWRTPPPPPPPWLLLLLLHHLLQMLLQLLLLLLLP